MDIKKLKQIIQLCRKTGVTSIKLDGLELQLGAMPMQRKIQDFSIDFPEANIKVPQYQELTEVNTKEMADKIATDELTEEQLLFYSAQGHVEQ